jgi:hypothetical protein
MKGDFGNGGSNQIHRLLCGVLSVRMNPGTLFPDVGHFEKVGIESCRVNGLTVRRFVHSRRAGSHDYSVNATISDIVLDQVLAGVGTHVLIISSHSHMGKGFGKGCHLLDIDRCRNINSTVTDKNAYFHFSNAVGRR